jgi:hypothetical protein
MGNRKKWGKIGAPKSAKRKKFMKKIRKKPRIDQREKWQNSRSRGKGGRFQKKGMNPALETVLVIASISQEAWNRLPESRKKQIHEAVRKGQLQLAKRLAR